MMSETLFPSEAPDPPSYGTGAEPSPSPRTSRGRRAAKQAAPAPLPAYATGVPRTGFDPRRAEVVWLERGGAMVKAGLLDRDAEVYRLKAHYWAGGYELGVDEWDEIRGRGVAFLEADQRGKTARKIYVVRLDVADAQGEFVNTPKGPRYVIPYDSWVAEAPPTKG